MPKATAKRKASSPADEGSETEEEKKPVKKTRTSPKKAKATGSQSQSQISRWSDVEIPGDLPPELEAADLDDSVNEVTAHLFKNAETLEGTSFWAHYDFSVS